MGSIDMTDDELDSTIQVYKATHPSDREPWLPQVGGNMCPQEKVQGNNPLSRS